MRAGINVLVVFGTRPEAIKMCPLVKELKKYSNFQTTVCVTGQHRQMLDSVMSFFGVKPEYDLAIMKQSQTLSDITSTVLQQMGEVLDLVKPSIVLVHGDTSTSFATALSCYYHHIPVGHVEAGLRTHDIYSPWPEEFNRQAVDILSDLYFAPTNTAKDMLVREGKEVSRVFVTGNTVIDALRYTVRDDYYHEDLEWSKGSKLILMTAHRRENIGEPMRDMFKAIRKIVDDNKDCKVIYPVHMNPQVRIIAEKELGGHERIKLIEPLDVIDFHNFISRSYLILTDSGGIQEEASTFGIPVLVMRDTTERPEGIKAGFLRLVGTDTNNIVKHVSILLNDRNEYKKMAIVSDVYGDGHACVKIIEVLRDNYGQID